LLNPMRQTGTNGRVPFHVEDPVTQILNTWAGLDLRKRITVVTAVIATALALYFVLQVATQPRMTLLYAQLEESAAGDVVRALEQRGVPYEVRSGAIFVDSSQRDSLRLTLASEGLPANGPKGYELLDSLTGFGTTAQMFDAAYWRAKEGELARTILSGSGVSAARVHIANVAANPFLRDVPVTASVFLTSTSGSIDPDLARAMRYLVASAVPQMEPAQVSIIDSKGRLVSAQDGVVAANTAENRGDQLRDRVQRLVEARVGRGNAVVEVSVDTVTETESILERRFDPNGRVAISTETEERTRQSKDGAANVTVASNLPDGAAAAGDPNSSQDSETRERVNYEVSETTREITRVPGAIRRLTVAVLVNGTTAPDDNGQTVFSPLPDAELSALRELVAAAVGFDQTRGDEITIRSMAFEQTLANGTAGVAEPWYARAFDLMALAQMAVLGLVALLIGLFVLRPILASRNVSAPLQLDASGTPEPDPAPALATAPFESELEDNSSDLPMMMAPASSFDADFGEETEVDSDPIERLRGLIEARKEETVEVLRTWLDEKEEAQ